MIKLHFQVDPIPKGRPRFTRSGHTYTPKKTKDFEENVKHLAALQMHTLKHAPLTGPLKVKGYFFLKRPKKPKNTYPRKDIDNLIKSTFDALNGVAWEDDSQVCILNFEKNYSNVGSITIFIEAVQ